MFEERAALGRQAGLAGGDGEESGGGEIVDERDQEIGRHVFAYGVDAGFEAFVGFGLHGDDGVEDAGVLEGPPGDEGAVAGDQALGGLLREFTGVGEQGSAPEGWTTGRPTNLHK
jgi:hypothetical protein